MSDAAGLVPESDTDVSADARIDGTYSCVTDKAIIQNIEMKRFVNELLINIKLLNSASTLIIEYINMHKTMTVYKYCPTEKTNTINTVTKNFIKKKKKKTRLNWYKYYI
jgi:hypothetical protein